MNFFITGFPGFIAERLVENLARTVYGAKFFLLVQPSFVEKAARDVSEIAARAKVSVENFEIVVGDITTDDLGLSPENAEKICRETTHVFHLAAVYDLAVLPGTAQRANVTGTRNVNRLAAQIKNLRVYNYVSTCYVAGRRRGLILETELEHNAGFRNYYEETKYLAELEVERLKADLPVTILRPSVVVGDSRTGATAKYDGIYYLIQYIRKFPPLLGLLNIGNARVRLNLVPVDFVVDAMTALAADTRAIGKTLQLADPAPLTTEELFEAIAASIVKRKSVATLPARLVETSLGLPFSPALTGMPHVAAPYFFIEQEYDTALASELLAAHNVGCPRFPDYVDNLIKFVEKNPKL